ncbi:MAG TPA: DUF3048 domain-containing protein [Chondromyces sp.]|nr:DUF3048 domain-containing protein [Chondromyces sp.]
MKKLLLLLLAGAFVLAGCGGNGKVESLREELEPSAEEQDILYPTPLTGLMTNKKPSSRAVAVVINNHPTARPQTGLQQADLVYEVLAEGNMTRFLAIYQSEQPKKAGPVRSARDYFIELADGYDSLFIAHGYSPEAKDLLESGEIDQLNGIAYDGEFFKRDATRVAPHNSYVSFKGMLDEAEKKGYETERAPNGLFFLTQPETEALTGKRAEDITITYSDHPSFHTQYVYMPEEKKYKRLTGGEPDIDRETKAPIEMENILIVEADHHIIDEQGRLEIDLVSGGKGYFIQNGFLNEVEWSNVNGRILPYKDGKPLGFIPGRTWVNIIPASRGLSEMVDVAN